MFAPQEVSLFNVARNSITSPATFANNFTPGASDHAGPFADNPFSAQQRDNYREKPKTRTQGELRDRPYRPRFEVKVAGEVGKTVASGVGAARAAGDTRKKRAVLLDVLVLHRSLGYPNFQRPRVDRTIG